MQALVERFKALTDREQLILIIAAVVVVVGLFYLAIWSPMNDKIALREQQIETQQELLTFVQQSAQRAIQLRRSSGNRQQFNGSLTQAVNQTTSRHNIIISRMQPQGEELQVWIDQAPFNSVLDWLNALERMGVVIIQLDITESEAPGQINVRRLQLGKV